LFFLVYLQPHPQKKNKYLKKACPFNRTRISAKTIHYSTHNLY
jgi:hypothetical protein